MSYDRLARAMAAIPVIIGMTIINTVLASAMGMLVFVQLLSVYGWSKLSAEVVAVLTAVAVLAYIWFQPKIRNYIKSKE